ncbi:uncharacterized protein LOC119830512 [Zerene cesonia]|uniref:uncharacterized protein LOC119830512 n=1 Tax=Zerene cesonia TaxID=33412 RepID=UPI0018E594FE|nr:uncharacterized protein LOC119830512 [Zerene cesonia]
MTKCRWVCLIVYCVLFFNLRITNSSRSHDRVTKLKFSKNNLTDIPSKSDLIHYLEIIEKVIKFYIKNVNEVDMNVYFGLFLNWKRYLAKVYNVDEGVPSPTDSDRCLASLAENRSNFGHFNKICHVDKFCYKMIKNGTDLGYALTHRLLFLLSARHGRSCSIFSKQEDRNLSEKFCFMSYIEAQTIVMHDFRLIDLLLESICLCALNGHVQFLRQSWLDQIANYQTAAGCFGQTINNKNIFQTQKPREWKLNRGADQDIFSGLCNGHVTALAVATYSIAVRLILETAMY